MSFMKLNSLKRTAAAMMAVAAGVLMFAGGAVAAVSFQTGTSVTRVKADSVSLHVKIGHSAPSDSTAVFYTVVREDSVLTTAGDTANFWSGADVKKFGLKTPKTDSTVVAYVGTAVAAGADSTRYKIFYAAASDSTTAGDSTRIVGQTIIRFVPGRVIGVKGERVISTAGNSIKISWSGKDDAEGYGVKYQLVRDNAGLLTTSGKVGTPAVDSTGWKEVGKSATSTNLENLKKGVEYKVRVYGKGQSNTYNTYYSDSVTVKTGDAPDAPKWRTAADSVVEKTTGAGFVTLKWSKPDFGGQVDSKCAYKVNYKKSDDTKWTDVAASKIDFAKRTATIDKLTNGETYEFKIWGTNGSPATTDADLKADTLLTDGMPGVPDSYITDGLVNARNFGVTLSKGDAFEYKAGGNYYMKATVDLNSITEAVVGAKTAWRVDSVKYSKDALAITKIQAASGKKNDLSWETTGFKVGDVDNNEENITVENVTGTWSATIYLSNYDPVSPGYLLKAERTSTFVINKRSFQSTVSPSITATATIAGSNTAYEGTEKTIVVVVKDGSTQLVEGVHYETNLSEVDVTNAGTRTVKVTAKAEGPYDKSIETTPFTIGKATLIFSSEVPEVPFSKGYDGTVNVDTAGSAPKPAVKFLGKVSKSEVALQYGQDYVVEKLKYNSAAAGSDKEVTFDVVLLATDNTKNYTLESKGYTLKKQIIAKADPKPEFFTAKLGSAVLGLEEAVKTVANGSAKAATVGWAVPAGTTSALAGGTITVNYSKKDSDSLFTAGPKEIGEYDVVVKTKDNSNVAATAETGLKVATFEITDGLEPIIEAIPDTSYYSGESVTLKVVARNPADTTKFLTSGIQWYEIGDEGARVKKSSGATQVVNSKTVGVLTYVADVTFSTNQVPKTKSSNEVKVEVKPERVSLKGATVSVNDQFEYTGSAITVLDGQVSVVLGTQTLSAGTDYTVSKHSNNVNAGEDAAVITVTGTGAYKDSEIGTFTITKKAVTVEDLAVAAYSVEFSGKEQPIVVTPKKGLSGLGAVTATYSPDTLPRVGVGTWSVTLDIAEGGNFLAGEGLALPNSYKITKVRWDKDVHLTYTEINKTVIWTGKDNGAVATPAKKGVAANYTGDLRVVYEAGGIEYATAVGDSLTPTTYAVKVKGPADDNFTICDETIGTITVLRFGDAVLDANREIPVGGVTADQAAVAPVKVIASTFSVGPNPVSNGAVSIYWNGSKSVNGKLAVFTSNGKKIASVPVSGSKKIGAWNAIGAPEGSYLIKGVLTTRDGEKVKVSTLVGVTR
jgi:hypothetical protein